MIERIIGLAFSLAAIIAICPIILVANQHGVFPNDAAALFIGLDLIALAVYAIFVFVYVVPSGR